MTTIQPPESNFNFAQHLLAANAKRADKIALIDDAGQLTFGQLAEQVRRFASGLQKMGLQR